MIKGPGGVSFVGRSSLSRRVLYWRFHCIYDLVIQVYTDEAHSLSGVRRHSYQLIADFLRDSFDLPYTS